MFMSRCDGYSNYTATVQSAFGLFILKNSSIFRSGSMRLVYTPRKIPCSYGIVVTFNENEIVSTANGLFQNHNQ